MAATAAAEADADAGAGRLDPAGEGVAAAEASTVADRTVAVAAAGTAVSAIKSATDLRSESLSFTLFDAPARLRPAGSLFWW
jgi:hypothetical protein